MLNSERKNRFWGDILNFFKTHATVKKYKVESKHANAKAETGGAKIGKQLLIPQMQSGCLIILGSWQVFFDPTDSLTEIMADSLSQALLAQRDT